MKKKGKSDKSDPQIRKRILRGYGLIVGGYALAGLLLLIWTVVLATNISPQMLHRNYDSIEAGMKMSEAWAALRHPTEYPALNQASYRTQFQRALDFAKSNITEPGERESLENIEKVWGGLSPNGQVSEAQFYEMNASLSKLVEVNKLGMFAMAKNAQQIQETTIRASFAFFVLGAIIAFAWAEKCAYDIAKALGSAS